MKWSQGKFRLDTGLETKGNPSEVTKTPKHFKLLSEQHPDLYPRAAALFPPAVHAQCFSLPCSIARVIKLECDISELICELPHDIKSKIYHPPATLLHHQTRTTRFPQLLSDLIFLFHLAQNIS